MKSPLSRDLFPYDSDRHRRFPVWDCPFFPVPLPGPALLGPRPADDNCFQAPHGAGKHKFRATQGGDQRRRQPGQMGAQYIRKKLVSHDEGRRIRRQKRQGFSKGPPPGFQRPGNGRAARDFPDMTKPAAAAVRNKDNGDAVLPEQADPVDLVRRDLFPVPAQEGVVQVQQQRLIAVLPEPVRHQRREPRETIVGNQEVIHGCPPVRRPPAGT